MHAPVLYGADPISDQVWRAHLVTRWRHISREAEREAWGEPEWRLARLLTDASWDQRPDGLYVTNALRALWQVADLHACRRFAASQERVA